MVLSFNIPFDNLRQIAFCRKGPAWSHTNDEETKRDDNQERWDYTQESIHDIFSHSLPRKDEIHGYAEEFFPQLHSLSDTIPRSLFMQELTN
jgi:hypothetical protein